MWDSVCTLNIFSSLNQIYIDVSIHPRILSTPMVLMRKRWFSQGSFPFSGFINWVNQKKILGNL